MKRAPTHDFRSEREFSLTAASSLESLAAERNIVRKKLAVGAPKRPANKTIKSRVVGILTTKLF